MYGVRVARAVPALEKELVEVNLRPSPYIHKGACLVRRDVEVEVTFKSLEDQPQSGTTWE